jgi:hypothetical protein
MSPHEFVKNLVEEFRARCDLYAPGGSSQAEVATRIRRLGLSPQQEADVTSLVRLAVAETMYGILCGLEGYGSLGHTQGPYRLHSESGELLSGALDSLFFEQVPELRGA